MAYKEIDESNIILIDSVSSFIEMIKQVKETKEAQDGTSTELYFRGQETEFWDIEPSIFRDDMLSIEHKLMQIPLQKPSAALSLLHRERSSAGSQKRSWWTVGRITAAHCLRISRMKSLLTQMIQCT